MGIKDKPLCPSPFRAIFPVEERPATPLKDTVNKTDDFRSLLQRYGAPESVFESMSVLAPPIDTIRSFDTAFQSPDELTQDLMDPLGIPGSPDVQRVPARGAIRRAWAGRTAVVKTAVAGRRLCNAGKLDGDEDKLDTDYRKTATGLIFAAASIKIPLVLHPYDKILGEIIRRRKNRANRINFDECSKNAPEARRRKEEDGKVIDDGAKLVSGDMSKGNRPLAATCELYRSIKVTLRGYLLDGPEDFCPLKLFNLRNDGDPELNPDGTARRRPPWSSLRVIIFYLTSRETMFLSDATLGGFGGNSISHYDMAVRTGRRELGAGNPNASLGGISPYEHWRVRRKYP